MISREKVEEIARLARLGLTEEEKSLYTDQLSLILGYIDSLGELDAGGAAPMVQPLIKKAETSDGSTREFENIDGIHNIAPEFRDGFFSVKKVL